MYDKVNGITQIPAPAYLLTAEPRPTLSWDNRENVAALASALRHAFTWNDTIEGHAFWLGVYRRLNRLAEGEPLR